METAACRRATIEQRQVGQGMGTFSVRILVEPVDGSGSQKLMALVDTGAISTVVPASILRGLGVVPTRTRTFVYANGQTADLGMAEVRVTVEDQDTTTWAIFGEDESGEALLGAVTLQELLLGIDTYHERLVPIQGLLK